MYSKATCRSMLLRLKLYVKLGPLCDEFGLSRVKLSCFMSNDSYDREISVERLNDFILFVENRLFDLF